MAGIEGVKPGAPKDPVKFPKRLPMKEKIPGPSQDAQFPKCMDHSAHPLPAPLFYSVEAFPQCSCAVGAPRHMAGFFPYVTKFSPFILFYLEKAQRYSCGFWLTGFVFSRKQVFYNCNNCLHVFKLEFGGNKMENKTDDTSFYFWIQLVERFKKRQMFGMCPPTFSVFFK